MKKKEANQENHDIDNNKNLMDQLITIGTSAGGAKVIIMEGFAKKAGLAPEQADAIQSTFRLNI